MASPNVKISLGFEQAVATRITNFSKAKDAHDVDSIEPRLLVSFFDVGVDSIKKFLLEQVDALCHLSYFSFSTHSSNVIFMVISKITNLSVFS